MNIYSCMLPPIAVGRGPRGDKGESAVDEWYEKVGKDAGLNKEDFFTSEKGLLGPKGNKGEKGVGIQFYAVVRGRCTCEPAIRVELEDGQWDEFPLDIYPKGCVTKDDLKRSFEKFFGETKDDMQQR